jgi:predicted nucleic acid-binding protein
LNSVINTPRLGFSKLSKSFKYNNVLQCNKLDKIIISDASTLILLQKIALLDKLLKNMRFIIPSEVYQEAVTKGKAKKFSDSYRIDEHVKTRKIVVKELKNSNTAASIREEFGLGEGEAQAIALFLQENGNMLAVDDHKAVNVCKIYNIPFMTALTFVVFAHNKKVVNKEVAKDMIDNLSVFGRYKNELIHDAYYLIKVR